MPAEPIDPAGITWTRVDPRYVTVRMIGAVTSLFITLAILAAPLVLTLLEIVSLPLWLCLSALGLRLLWAAISLILIPRRVRAIGYHERDDDLLVRTGLLFQRVVAVPYGRLQYVDIQAGPIMRRFGLCSVELKTASAATDASIPGVVRAEGARLRDELSARGQARLAGL